MGQETRCLGFGHVPDSGGTSLAKLDGQGAAQWGGIKVFAWALELDSSLLMSESVRLTEGMVSMHQWIQRLRATGADPEHLNPAGSLCH